MSYGFAVMVRTILIAMAVFCSVARADEQVKTGAAGFAYAAEEEKQWGGTAEDRAFFEKCAKEFRQLVKVADLRFIPSLRNAETMEVFSLLPDGYDEGSTDVTRFHGYPILGQVLLERPARFQRLRDSMITGIGPHAWLMCFSPRHGVRIKSKSGTVDLLICFECAQTGVFGVSWPKNQPGFTFGTETKNLLNEILDEAKIPREVPKSDTSSKAQDEIPHLPDL